MSFLKKFKILTAYILGFFYFNVGITHFTNPDFFLIIMPTYIPWQEFFVYLSGVFEILFGLMLFFKKTRTYGGLGIFILLIFVYPANIYLYESYEAQELMKITKEGSLVRLFFQIPLLVLAFWHSKEKTSNKFDYICCILFIPTILYFVTLTN